jgi:peptide/nickel transport system ATP-binding protein
MSEPVLEIKNLSIDFVNDEQIVHALQNISFDVNEGEVVALVGESGSGKSVTALSILRLLQIKNSKIISGSISFNQDSFIDLLRCDEDTLRAIRGNKIAMIFQEPMTSLNPVITCGEQVSEALQTHKKISKKEAKKQTIQLFEEVELPNPLQMYKRYPHQLSGGQKQRVMIAMAMCCEPGILICDEPTTALDVMVQKSILMLIKKLQQQNSMSVIFISHDFGVVADIADKIIVMYKGKIVEQNTAKNILTNPEHLYTKALLACRPALHKSSERLPVVSDFIQQSAISNQQSVMSHEPLALSSEASNTNYQSQTILSVQNLKVWFPAKTDFFGKITEYIKAVDDVSFDVQQGEILGLVGGSGCGKTTLGKSLLHLIKPTSGKIFFKQKDISQLRNNELVALRKEMQIIFQDPYSSLNPQKKTGDAIAEPMIVHQLFKTAKRCSDRVFELLEKVNLPAAFYDRYPHELSGGQRQRVVIARALALRPSFIVCDECVSALDVSVQAQILNLLNDLKKEFDFTVIFISHDMSVVRYLCERIIVMRKGQIEETGSAEQVWQSPQSPYTKALLAAVPLL